MMKVTVKCTCGCETTISNAPFELKEDFFKQDILVFKCAKCKKVIAVLACDVEKINIIPRNDSGGIVS